MTAHIKLHIIDIVFTDGVDGIALTFPNGSECLKQFGMGLFLCEWKKGEVTITRKAKDFILEHGRKMDLGGVEFFDGPRIGFIQQSIPKDGISTNGESKKWIRRLPVAA